MRQILLTLVALLLPLAAHAQPTAIGFGEEETLTHRLAGEDVVDAAVAPMFDGIHIRVTISPAGEVIDAQVKPDEYLSVSAQGRRLGRRYPTVDTAPALAAARRWWFRPFTYRGVPVTALGEIQIHYREPGMKGTWQDPAAPLPPIDYGALRITLMRGASFWGSPQYRVTIYGDGTVIFTTDAPTDVVSDRLYWAKNAGSVVAPGTHWSRISRTALDALIERFRTVHFFGLKPQYVGAASDQPTQLLRFESGSERFELLDYAGWATDMPRAVHELDEAIDEAVGSARWVKGDAETARLVLAEGLDVHGKAARDMAQASIREGDGQAALDLIDAGLPLETIVNNRVEQVPLPLGAALLLTAVEEGKAALFLRLADAGWLARAPRDLLAGAMIYRTAGCEPEIARRVIATGIDINAPLPERKGWGDTPGNTLLHAALESHGICKGDLAGYVATLLALGADPDRVYGERTAALFHAQRLDLVEALLAAGARADVRDGDGRSLVFSLYYDAPVRRLLEAGADPRGTDSYGRSLRKLAVEHEWPATLAWLDAHGIP